MSIAITKKVNHYNKTNTGKVVASGVGAAVGGYWASKNTDLIRQKINDIYVGVAKSAGEGALDVLKDVLTGKTKVSELGKGSKFLVKIGKYGIKFLNAVKKHPVVAGTIAGAMALFCVGKVVDDNVNYYRAKAADKK